MTSGGDSRGDGKRCHSGVQTSSGAAPPGLVQSVLTGLRVDTSACGKVVTEVSMAGEKLPGALPGPRPREPFQAQ